MNVLRTSITAFALLLAGSVVQAAPADPEAQIAKALDGRVAGQPVDCIMLRNIRSSQIVDRTAVLYTMNGGTIYLARPTSGAPFLRRDLALITDTHSPQLCGVDIVRLYDTSSRFEAGSIGLGKFVPYEKPGKGRR